MVCVASFLWLFFIDDELFGSLGLDSLTGGAGKDRFVLVSGLTAEWDIIQDYQDGLDLLELTGSLTFGDLTLNQNGADTDIIETATKWNLSYFDWYRCSDY